MVRALTVFLAESSVEEKKGNLAPVIDPGLDKKVFKIIIYIAFHSGTRVAGNFAKEIPALYNLGLRLNHVLISFN